MAKSLEPGDIVRVHEKHQEKVRRMFPIGATQQCRVLEIAKRQKFSFAMVRVGLDTKDTEGHWLWNRQIRRVPSKLIRPEWKDAKKAVKS